MARLSLHHCVAIAILAASLSACDSSGRFGDSGGGGFGRSAVDPAPPPRQQTFTPVPTSRVSTSTLPPVTSQPLPAPTAAPNASPTAPSAPSANGLPPAGSSIPIDPTPARPAAPAVAEPVVAPPPVAPVQTASRPEPAPAASAAPSRTSVTGNWTAKEAAGRSCKVTLSGTPTLDLYKASSVGCQSKELQRVNAWELRGDEVYLYEAGGGIAARLKKSGSNYEGSASKTGAPVTLSK
jgi:Protease inhibitor Inh